jgi:mono/diheme cytochrome c family protein
MATCSIGSGIHQIEQHTAMPEMGVSDEDSKDIAAYLYTLH